MMIENPAPIQAFTIRYYPDKEPEIFIVCQDNEAEASLRYEAEKIKRVVRRLYE